MQIVIWLFVLWSLLVATGCQTTPDALESVPTATSHPTPIPPTETESPMTSFPATPTDPILQTLIEQTKEDLANRLTASTDDISLVEATAVEWSDSSLDCPQPGMDYLQVITPGYRIVLQANDQLFEYHSNRDSYFVYCEDRSPPIVP